MEQQKKNIAPLPVAADPVHIPGLTVPVAAKQPEDPEQSGEPEQVVEPAEADVDTGGAEAEAEAAAEPEPEAEAEADGEGAEGAEGGGPSFSVSDRRGSITADRAGVRYTLDDQEAEFGWDEILAVETSHSRFGRRFTVTVHTEGSRWYPGEVVAPDKAALGAWDEELDAVLDAYFEE
ncbi:hypothetical protein ACX6XY_06835 [Streptomyces sp. O3]